MSTTFINDARNSSPIYIFLWTVKVIEFRRASIQLKGKVLFPCSLIRLEIAEVSHHTCREGQRFIELSLLCQGEGGGEKKR